MTKRSPCYKTVILFLLSVCSFLSLFLLSACSGVSTAPTGTTVPGSATTLCSLPYVNLSVDGSRFENPETGILVSVSPKSPTLQSAQSLQFTAKVVGSELTAVKWSAARGSISPSGHYTAPSVTSQIIDTISAISMADTKACGTASVVVTSNAGNAGGGGTVGLSVSPNSGTLQSGHSMQFTSTVTNTTNTAVTWDAVFGSVSSSGLYTAPNVTSQTVDTVSAISQADPTKYASASVVVQSNDGNVAWTVTNQQPLTQEFYAQSIFAKPLPADAGNHLAHNSDAIVNNIFGGQSGNNILNPTPLAEMSHPDTLQVAFYYASQSDPLYKVVSCSPHPTNSSYDPSFAPTNYFHMPNRAQWSGQTNDQDLTVWDQSSDIDATIGGRIISFYISSWGITKLPACTCTTKACADTTSSCQLANFDYCSYSHPSTDTTSYNEAPSAWTSINNAPGTALLRENELIQGTINHVIMVDTACVHGSYVFPAYGDVCHCSDSSCNGNLVARGLNPNDTLRPPNGSLFWIDSGFNCGTLPTWQTNVCVAMQKYGAYLRDTGGEYPQQGIYVNTVESPYAWDLIGQTTPLWAWLEPQATNCSFGDHCEGANVLRLYPDNQQPDLVYLPFFNMPGLIEGNHLHIIDPCIPLRMAGQPGSC